MCSLGIKFALHYSFNVTISYDAIHLLATSDARSHTNRPDYKRAIDLGEYGHYVASFRVAWAVHEFSVAIDTQAAAFHQLNHLRDR
jgi:hypothetical protein